MAGKNYPINTEDRRLSAEALMARRIQERWDLANIKKKEAAAIASIEKTDAALSATIRLYGGSDIPAFDAADGAYWTDYVGPSTDGERLHVNEPQDTP